MQLLAGKDARLGGAQYQRHRPEQTLLYRLVEEHYPRFLKQLAFEGKTLPEYVRREFEDFLHCGRLEHGFLRVRCDSCHAERLVAFSCKRRAFCPSCGARRMAETSAHLIDRVLPERPIRQWVLSVPIPLRFLFASRPAIMGKVLGIVYRTIATHLIHKAGHTHATAKTGAVTLIQCFGGSVNLNIHFHMLFLDGAYVDGPHGLRFRWVNAPTSAELTHLAQTIAHRTARFLERQGLLERDAEQAYLTADSGDDEAIDSLLQPAITYRIAVGPHQGRKVMTLQTLPPDDPFEPGAGQVAGFSLHAGVAARAHERDKLERLCRYVSRPPVAERRLSLTTHGNVRYRLKTPYRDGTTHIIFEPLDFIAKLAALVPRPRINLTRYHGLFAPNCRIRAQITPVRRQSTPAPNPEDSPTPPRAGMSWAQRLKRVFNIDIETCLHCGGTLKVIACIEDPDIIHKILTHLEHKADAASPAIRPPQRAPPQVDWIA